MSNEPTRIIVEIVNRTYKDTKFGDRGAQMEVDVIIEGGKRLDRAMGILLQAYLDTAREFLIQHPKDCQDCPAVRHTKLNILALAGIHKEVTGYDMMQYEKETK